MRATILLIIKRLAQVIGGIFLSFIALGFFITWLKGDFDSPEQKKQREAKEVSERLERQEKANAEYKSKAVTDTVVDTDHPAHPTRIKSNMLNGKWPLTVSEGNVVCVKVGRYRSTGFVWTDSKGEVRGMKLNGTAWPRTDDERMPLPQFFEKNDSNPIWSDDPEYPGTKKDISALLEVAQAACDDTLTVWNKLREINGITR